MKNSELRTPELKNELQKLIDTPDRWVSINGEMYIYNKATNTVRRRYEQTSGTIHSLVGCFAFGKFVWCES